MGRAVPLRVMARSCNPILMLSRQPTLFIVGKDDDPSDFPCERLRGETVTVIPGPNLVVNR